MCCSGVGWLSSVGIWWVGHVGMWWLGYAVTGCGCEDWVFMLCGGMWWLGNVGMEWLGFMRKKNSNRATGFAE